MVLTVLLARMEILTSVSPVLLAISSSSLEVNVWQLVLKERLEIWRPQSAEAALKAALSAIWTTMQSA